ncbi:DUF551 domain-containing protein [Acinetobacter sp. BMW17]|uniref:DUF551 domain-containing protein n=1 Tax=Acinetobacter sp. BMW17 TaxID=1795629 RepID=UPI0009D6FDBB|nr:DUF551 domain-containing protein [Acinetobacter sp. BMW17]
MDISEKQAVWREQKPLFEAEFIHSHLLPFFNFNENTGDYEIKSECLNNTDDEDRKVAYEALNTGWVMWLRAKRDVKAQAVPEWISVGDSLPPVDETVLVCWDYAADIEPEKEYLTLDEDYNEYWPNCQDEPPTHWLPLPKVIKAQEIAND